MTHTVDNTLLQGRYWEITKAIFSLLRHEYKRSVQRITQTRRILRYCVCTLLNEGRPLCLRHATVVDSVLAVIYCLVDKSTRNVAMHSWMTYNIKSKPNGTKVLVKMCDFKGTFDSRCANFNASLKFCFRAKNLTKITTRH